MPRRVLVLLFAALLSGCGSVIHAGNYIASQSSLQADRNIGDRDYGDLRAGRLTALKERYEALPAVQLGLGRLSLLCDLRLKSQEFGPAESCNDALRAEAIRRNDAALLAKANGRRALFALSQRRYDDAAVELAEDTSDGGRYLRALAQARSGSLHGATLKAAAAHYERRYDPRPVFYAASLYAAAGDCDAALKLLEDPERRLLADYGLSASGRGGISNRAPFRLDVFDEFSFGWFNDLSFAPAGNVYIENLAVHCLRKQNRAPEAEEHLNRLLAFPDLPAYRDVHWLALYQSGLFKRARNDGSGAVARFREAIEVVEAARTAIVTENGRIAFAVDKEDLYGDLVDALIADHRPDEALEVAERAKGRALVDMLTDRKDFAPPDIPRDAANRLVGALASAESGLTRMASRGEGDTAAALTAVHRATARIRQESPALASLVSAVPRRFSELAAVLEPDEAAIVYYRSHKTWWAFLLSNGSVVALDLGDNDIKSKAGKFRREASNANSAAYGASARQLHDAILAPVLRTVPARKLLIVPHGILHNVPFAALDDGSGPLIAKRAFRLAPSLSALVESRGRTAVAGARGLIFGNPTRSEPDSSLPDAEAEAEELKRIYPTAAIYLREQATVDRFRREIAGKSFVHIAAHGEFVAVDPLRSRLKFSTMSDGKSDLTVDDLYMMRIDVPLAVLSACQTAFSEIRPGDDLIGLTRGFLFSGVDSIVAGQWAVSSESTRMLMTGFHKALRSGSSGAEALRQAQIEVMEKYKHPYYWAAFSIMGMNARI